MYEPNENSRAASDVQPRSINLDRWMGRRDAFGAIAGRCSAADAECLRLIRDRKLFVELAPSWDEFCRVHLHVSRKKMDRQIWLLNEFGPAYFQVAQLTHITPNDYRTIAPHVTTDGLHVDGAVIALLPENTQQVSEAVAKLKRSVAPKESGEQYSDLLVKRCKALASALRATRPALDDRQRSELASHLLRVQKAAQALGVCVFKVIS